ncbi:MAG: CGNR zinc finger domain-containing protein [Anaerolineales bacterium]|jgi:predicted RNA-binding Zn ribbon-like protein
MISPYISKMPFLGGNLSLDFVNTVNDRHEDPLRNLLQNYLDLVTWVYFSSAISVSQKEELLQKGRENQRKANQIYKNSLQLREAFYDLVVNMIDGDEISQVNMQLINQWLSKASSNLELTQFNDHFVLDWNLENFGLESVLWPIVRAFSDLITSEERKRIKQCGNCGYLFVDNSKNNSRRWCSMEICGNRVKARRHARRTRS